jgi:hypothetical protein
LQKEKNGINLDGRGFWQEKGGVKRILNDIHAADDLKQVGRKCGFIHNEFCQFCQKRKFLTVTQTLTNNQVSLFHDKFKNLLQLSLFPISSLKAYHRIIFEAK